MSAPSPQPLVIAADQIWNGLEERPGGPGELLIVDGRIAQIGPAVERPAGAEVVELAGHCLTPGFIDCHVHVVVNSSHTASFYALSSTQKALGALANLRTLLLSGFTTVRDLFGCDPEFITIDLRQAIEQGLIAGPRMVVAPQLLSATGGHGDMTGLLAPQYHAPGFELADGPYEVMRKVRENARAGADWIKTAASGGFATPSDDPNQTTWTQGELDALVAVATDLGLPVCAHAYGDEGAKRAVLAGVRSIEHGNLLNADTLQLMVERGTFLVPTLYTIMNGVENLDNPDHWRVRSEASHRKFSKYGDALLASASNVARSGVQVAFGTDAGMFPHGENWREFLAMVKQGLTPLRALKAATSLAAELLQRPELGKLEVGAAADLVAMPGDPFEDIELTGRVDFVMQGGRIHKRPTEKGLRVSMVPGSAAEAERP